MGYLKGVRIYGQQPNHFRFADDIVLITDNREYAKNPRQFTESLQSKVDDKLDIEYNGNLYKLCKHHPV